MKKYLVEVFAADSSFDEFREYSVKCSDLEKAHSFQENYEDSVPEGMTVTHSKVIVVVTCDCGEEVECRNFTNTCECGLDFNFSGQELAPRSQWGEETGEHWSDIWRPV